MCGHQRFLSLEPELTAEHQASPVCLMWYSSDHAHYMDFMKGDLSRVVRMEEPTGIDVSVPHARYSYFHFIQLLRQAP